MSSTTKRRQFLAKQIFQFHMSPSVTPENAFNPWFPLNLAASSGKRMFCHCHHNQRSGYFKCMSVTWWYVNMLMVSFESCSIQWRKDVLSLPSQAWTSHPVQSCPLFPLCCTWVASTLVRVIDLGSYDFLAICLDEEPVCLSSDPKTSIRCIRADLRLRQKLSCDRLKHSQTSKTECIWMKWEKFLVGTSKLVFAPWIRWLWLFREQFLPM